MKKILLFLLIMFIPFYINAEELKMDWQKSWSGSGYDSFSGFTITDTGEMIACGATSSTDIEGLTIKGRTDAVIVKYDKDGNILWQKSFGGSSNDSFKNFVITDTGEIIAYGTTYSTDIEGLTTKGAYDAVIVKYDKDGNLLWKKAFGGNSEDEFRDFVVTNTGEVVAYGTTSSTDIDGLTIKGDSDEIIVKYDKDGNLLWQINWGGSNFDKFSDFVITDTGEIIVYGIIHSSDIEGLTTKGSSDAVIVKYDKDGNLLWQINWGGSGYDSFSDFVITDTGEIIVYGYTSSIDIEGLTIKGASEAVIVKYDKDGNLLWQKSFGGSSYDNFLGLSLTETGEIIAYGNTSSIDIEGLTIKGDSDAVIVKYDKDGNLLWQKALGGSSYDNFLGLSLTETEEIIVAGETTTEDVEGYNQDIMIVKYDKDGNLLWQKNWDKSGCDYFSDLNLTKTGNIITYGNIMNMNAQGMIVGEDKIIVKYDKDGNLLWQKNWSTSNDDFVSFINITETEDIMMYGSTTSLDIEGLTNKGGNDAIIIKYSIKYNTESIANENGTSTVIQQGSKGIITSTPNVGYEVDEFVIKDKSGNVLDVEVTKLENGTYTFPLYSDVSVEVIYKEIITNPKTGVIDIISTLFVGFIISMIGFLIVKKYNERLEI